MDKTAQGPRGQERKAPPGTKIIEVRYRPALTQYPGHAPSSPQSAYQRFLPVDSHATAPGKRGNACRFSTEDNQ